MKIITDDSSKSVDLKANKSFVEYFSVYNHTTSGLKNLILGFKKNIHIDLQNIEVKLMVVHIWYPVLK